MSSGPALKPLLKVSACPVSTCPSSLLRYVSCITLLWQLLLQYCTSSSATGCCKQKGSHESRARHLVSSNKPIVMWSLLSLGLSSTSFGLHTRQNWQQSCTELHEQPYLPSVGSKHLRGKATPGLLIWSAPKSSKLTTSCQQRKGKFFWVAAGLVPMHYFATL